MKSSTNLPLHGEFILQKSPTSEPTPPKTSPEKSSQSSEHDHQIPPDIKRKNLHFYSSLVLDPEDIEIINQLHNEEVHILLRRHLVTNVPWIFIIVIMMFIPIIISPLLSFFSIIAVSPSTIFSFLSLYYLAIFGYGLLKFSEWYFHVGLITNKRLVDVDMHNILYKNVAETHITSVEDVTYTKKGLLQSIFVFGDVFVQTQAVVRNFEYDKIPRPTQVAEIISQLAHIKRRKQ